MMTIRHSIATVGIVLALAAPAAAQDLEWLSRLESRIEAHALDLVEALGFEDVQRDRDDSARGPEIVERFSRTVRLGRNGTFDLSNVSGDVVVTGDGGDDVRIGAVKRTRDRDEAEGRARLQEVRIDVREQGNRVEVNTEYPRGRRNIRVSVAYTVSVPQDASVTLKTVSGDVRVTNVRGELSTQSVSGDLTATGARRLDRITSVSGDVYITDAESESQVTATTVSGNLIVRSLKARGIDTTTVSGDVTLEGIESGRASVRTVSGDIQYAGSLARNGRYEMNTHSGDVLLTVSTSGFDVEASTFSGDVRSDYAVTLAGSHPVTGDRSRRRGRSNTIRGSFGDAGAIVSLRSFSGDITITRR